MLEIDRTSVRPEQGYEDRVPPLDPPAAPPDAARGHFESVLRFETDCWDVHQALTSNVESLVVLDVRSTQAYDLLHVPGAVSLPYREISDEALSTFAAGATFVVYCNGPHCNGADRAAALIAGLGRSVKKMIGGIEGWRSEGFEFERQADQ